MKARNATDHVTKSSAAPIHMTEAHAYECPLKDTTNYVAECNAACLQVIPGKNCLQGNLVEILYGGKTTRIKTDNTLDIDQKP